MQELKVQRGFEEISEIYNSVQKVAEGKAWIAGGYPAYCVSESKNPPLPGDVDIFPCDEQTWDALYWEFHSQDTFAYRESIRAMTMSFFEDKPDIQIVRPPDNGNWSIKKLMQDFDFTVCKAVLINPETVLVDDCFYVDTREMRLRIENINNPIGAMMRVAKYTAKGYAIAPCEMVKILEDFAKADKSSQEKLLNDFRTMDHPDWERIRDDEPFIDDDWDDTDPSYHYY